MEETSKYPTFIRVARMQFCHNSEYEHGSDLHLNIEFDDIELEKSSAIAISYTWGEFDREDEVIGHDTEGTPLLLNLGKEWDVQEMTACLARLCIDNGEERGSRHAGCWIDQLCIRHTDEGFRTALANIPSIYRKLDVVALMRYLLAHAFDVGSWRCWNPTGARHLPCLLLMIVYSAFMTV
ncbi:uncharacterized protein Z518_05536 [Rhinocladiella mackenziei CBS 650.93]|uniref:Heterokaryon incompatibility domain-containing protein n=1 Tax=Rhinocladiella mackenziei CBS 650.93 TaxID=1442369 RepID=A0A0D2INF4_9EURO|nr:uncharacterized protein Z518_05536 [Rhinocladiella mackenziei CBS 650.93]KIX04666.1 hypothetical protein Z518_05536 [Rhinocladiella mackenziei CBS 650.93]